MCSWAVLLINTDFLTCIHLFELRLELQWSEAVLVKPVVPLDSLQHLQVTAYQPITSLHYHLHEVMKREFRLSLLNTAFTMRAH